MNMSMFFERFVGIELRRFTFTPRIQKFSLRERNPYLSAKVDIQYVAIKYPSDLRLSTFYIHVRVKSTFS